MKLVVLTRLGKDEPDNWKLFEKEEDNNFDEQVVTIQMSCRYLRKLVSLRTQDDFQVQRKASEDKLKVFLKRLSNGEVSLEFLNTLTLFSFQKRNGVHSQPTNPMSFCYFIEFS